MNAGHHLADRRPVPGLRHRPDCHRRRQRARSPRTARCAAGRPPGRPPMDGEAAMTGRTTRAERLAMPLARDAIRTVAEASGGCLRPVQLRRTDTDTGQVEQVLMPCGATLAASARPAPSGPSRCAPRSAGKAGTSRTNPTPARPARRQADLAARAARRGPAARATTPTPRARTPPSWTSCIAELDTEITRAGIRGTVADPGREDDRRAGPGPPAAARTPRTCPAARSARGPSARSTPPRTARPTGRRCSSP